MRKSGRAGQSSGSTNLESGTGQSVLSGGAGHGLHRYGP